jgi:cytochrome P450
VIFILRIGDLIFERTLKPWLMIDFIYKYSNSNYEQKKCLDILHGFTKKVIREREAEFDGCNFDVKRRTAFLDLLLKAKNQDLTLTDSDIQEEVDTFMFEGHDTTCAAAAWACHLIGSHPEIQKRLHEEIDQVFGNSERSITNADLQNLSYLECTIKETLRMFPSVPLLGRELQEDTFIGKFYILF